MKSARLLRFFALCGVLSFALASAHAQDSWQGSYGGFWSNGGNWTIGLPTSADNVVIYTGANDLVYLDVSPTVNSLTLGGAYNGYTSELSDNSIARMLTISQALTINPSGSLVLTGGSNVTIGTDFVNAGFVSTNSFFSIGGNFDNQGTAYLGGGISATGTFTTEAGAYSDFFGGVNHIGALVNNGYLEVDAGSTLIVAGGSSVTDIPSTAGYQIAGTFTIG